MADKFDEEVGRRIRFYRGLNKMTLESVGQRLGLTYQQIGKYEHGENRLSFQLAWRLKNLFKVSFEDLLPAESRTYKTLADIGAEFDFGKHAMLHKYFDKLSPHHKCVVVHLAKDLAMNTEESDENSISSNLR